MSKKSTIIAIIVGALIGSAIGFNIPISQAQQWSEPTEETYRYLNLFGAVMDRIRRSHVEEKTDKELIENALRGMMKALDQHSSYVDPKQFKNMNEQTRGSFFGIGAEVSYDKDKFGGAIKVTPMEGSPSAAAGLKAGDFIVEVNDKKVRDLDLMQGVDLIKGPKGTTVKLKIIREGVKKPIDIVVTRDKIKIQVVRNRVINEKIMYVKLSTFNENSTNDIRNAIRKMQSTCVATMNLITGTSTDCKSNEYAGLILDLRNNPGGLLNQANAISDLFLDEGTIVYTKVRGGIVDYNVSASEGQIIPKTMPMVVLINKFSASASEIVAGALKDLERATIVGVKSFGKGSVQSIIPLENGGALRLTTAKYYTASGATIHKVGITPDVVVDLKKTDVDPENPDRAYIEKMKRGYNDTQILKAVEILLTNN